MPMAASADPHSKSSLPLNVGVECLAAAEFSLTSLESEAVKGAEEP